MLTPLPEPMLAKGGPLPEGDYAYELEWDGLRALVSTLDRVRILSRQRWEMTPHLPELQALPRGIALDGELIAFGDDGKPKFPRLCERMLHGNEDIPITFIALDVLHAEGHSTTRLPYRERRLILEQLDSLGPHWSTGASYLDGGAGRTTERPKRGTLSRGRCVNPLGGGCFSG